MENTVEEIGGMKVFSNPEDLAASMSSEENQPTQEVVSEQPVAEPVANEQPTQDAPPQETQGEAQEQGTNEVQRETAEPETNTQQGYSDTEVETAVMSFLSEKLGREVTSFDDLSATQQAEANALDERVQAIAQFVEDTGRAPEDWFRYQSLNPESMDDMTAVRVQMANEYPNLSYEELDLLTRSKYKLDADIHADAEIKLSQLQLKIDGQKAREGVEQIRQKYSAPDIEQAAPESVFNDKWVSDMSREVDSIEGLEFDLGGEKTFEFGLDDNYKSQLKTKNARLNEYFDSFVRDDGSWDHESLSTQVALVDNIDKIIKSVYTQGLGDGQKTLVNTAANISTQSPQQGSQNNQNNPLADQLKNIMNGQANKLTFKI